jgi:hypothetical protein
MVSLSPAATKAGHGSLEEQQLFCVLVSLLKSLTLAAANRLSVSATNIHGCYALTLRQVMRMLQPMDAAAPATAPATAVILTLPWLVLLGRCCLWVSAQTASAISDATSTAPSSSSTIASTQGCVQ